jgi:hypothetical protein
MQHVQGQVTVERLRAQLRGLGVRISKGQIVTILTANKDAFHAEKDAILEVGLASAAWVTVDDTAARHAGANEYTTHIGNDCFAWFATCPSKSRLNFLDLLRAGHPDYVINATAAAYLVEHKVAEAVIASLLGHERRSFADDAAWQVHLDSLGLGAGCRRRVTEAAMIGAIVARGLLSDTVIVSDDSSTFSSTPCAGSMPNAISAGSSASPTSSTAWSMCSASWSGGSTPISSSTRTTPQPPAERH